MYVAVGSTNPVKVAATERALGDRAGDVAAVEVASGVPEQPRGIEQTVEGADARARRALGAGEYDLGVGIEGGVAEFPGTERMFVIMWVSVTDGDRIARGGGPSLPLPDDVASQVRGGAELGPLMDDLTGRAGTKRREGAAGILTDGHTERTEALRSAVSVALGPFVTEYYG